MMMSRLNLNDINFTKNTHKSIDYELFIYIVINTMMMIIVRKIAKIQSIVHVYIGHV